MSMNSFLAEMYGTDSAPADEATVKVAQYEAFAKLAADQGVDLSTMAPDQIQALFDETVKAASADGDADDKGDKGEEAKKEKAKAEFEEKKESAAKLAEADFAGRQMAHAFVHELGEIQKEAGAKDMLSAAGKWAKGVGRDAGYLPDQLRRAVDKDKVVSGHALKSLAGNKAVHVGGAAAALGVGTATGAGVAGRKKEASALDELAAVEAVKAAAAAGYDAEKVAEALVAVLVQGTPEQTKVAYAADFETGVQVRGLELLEAVGVPVDWDAAFGG